MWLGLAMLVAFYCLPCIEIFGSLESCETVKPERFFELKLEKRGNLGWSKQGPQLGTRIELG